MESKRILSLDAFRGYTVAAMIMVNFPGSWDHVFPTLRHSEWNGLTFTDLVAPFFLFIVGISICLAYQPKLVNGVNKTPLYRKIFWRGLKIYAVGMFLNALPFFNLSDLRWTGTLHRIAVVFVISAIIFLNTSRRQQALLAAILLIGYWIAMTTIPTPGYGKVMLEPGQNLAAWVDSQYLPGKMWEGTWDPEGILSTIPSTATCILGMVTGRIFLGPWEPAMKVNYLFLAGLLSSAVGYFWGLVFPVNENIWTSSFVMVTAGFASMVLGAFYLVIDIIGHKDWSMPGVIFGANAITAYVLGDVLSLLFYQLPLGSASLNQHLVGALRSMGMAPALASWLYALFFVCINFIPVWIMYRKQVFIKL